MKLHKGLSSLPYGLYWKTIIRYSQSNVPIVELQVRRRLNVVFFKVLDREIIEPTPLNEFDSFGFSKIDQGMLAEDLFQASINLRNRALELINPTI